MTFPSDQETIEKIKDIAKQGNNFYSSCLENPNNPLKKVVLNSTREEVVIGMVQSTAREDNAKGLKSLIEGAEKTTQIVYNFPVTVEKIDNEKLVVFIKETHSELFLALQKECTEWYESHRYKLGLLPPLHEIVKRLIRMGAIIVNGLYLFPTLFLENFRVATRISRSKIKRKELSDFGIYVEKEEEISINILKHKKDRKLIVKKNEENNLLVSKYNMNKKSKEELLDITAYKLVAFDAEKFEKKRQESYDLFVKKWSKKSSKPHTPHRPYTQVLKYTHPNDPTRIITAKEYALEKGISCKNIHRLLKNHLITTGE
jgi:hypothetical protein